MDPEKKIDEEWKRKAREEAAPEPGGRADAAADEGEASFLSLVSGLAVQALAAMGRPPAPDLPAGPADFAQAQFCIDLLGILEDRTRGNLNEEESKILAETLHELRMLFVEATMAQAGPANPSSHA
jgi:hypothetical protein